jgi:hypothetical protein
MKPTSPPTTAAPYHKFHPWWVGSSGGELTGIAVMQKWGFRNTRKYDS